MTTLTSFKGENSDFFLEVFLHITFVSYRLSDFRKTIAGLGQICSLDINFLHNMLFKMRYILSHRWVGVVFKMSTLTLGRWLLKCQRVSTIGGRESKKGKKLST